MRIKNLIFVFLLIALLLCGCDANADPVLDTTDPTPVETTDPSAATDLAPEWSGYTGERKDYVSYYSEGRDLEWEEDILYVAGVFLGEKYANGHPLLSDMEFLSNQALDGQSVEYINHYDAQLREGFLQDINELIPMIGELKDYEILFRLQKAIAKLGDLHSDSSLGLRYFYPLYLMPFYRSGQAELYAVRLPAEYEEHLYTKLVAINDVPLEEILTAMKEYISYENEYAVIEILCSYLTSNEFMNVIGVAEYKEQDTKFTFETEDGTRTDLYLDALSPKRLSREAVKGTTMYSADFLTYKDPDSCYWWEYLEEERILYVRFNVIREDYYLSYKSFVAQLRQHLKDVPRTKSVVIDLRGNPGGQFHHSLSIYLASLFNQMGGQKGYVLIDSSSFSAAIILPGSLRQLSDNVTLVGAPGGQPTNFFASSYTYTMPNSGESFSMSDSWWNVDASDTGDALMPDVVIRQSLEDLIAGKDTVMEYIITGKLP